MKTRGEIEAAICKGISRFEQDYMGRGPKDIHAYLIGDLLVVRLTGVLTVAEQQLVASLPAEKGRDLLKQVRIHLIETARPSGGNDPRRDGHPSRESASRHHHGYRRRGCAFHTRGFSSGSRNKEIEVN